MEPVSASLGIASAIPALITTCKQCIDIVQTIRHADKDCQLLSFELVSLHALLEQLEVRAKNSGQPKTDDSVEDAPKTPLGRMQARLSDLEKSLSKCTIDFEADKKRNILKRTFRGFRYYYQKSSIDELLQALERDKLYLTLEIQHDHEALSKAINTEVRDIRAFLTSLGDKLDRVGDFVEEEERTKMLEWISAQDESQYLTVPSASESLLGQTSPGDWFLRSTEFQTWSAGQNRILYCFGRPGTGKTVLSVITTNHLEQQIPTYPIASFFCSRKGQAEITYGDVLRSLLRQFLSQEEDLPDEVQMLWKHRNPRIPHASLDIVFKCLDALLENGERRFIVIDALDEFSEDESARQELLGILMDLMGRGQTYLMLTSRYDPQTIEEFVDEKPSCVGVEASVDDVRAYLETRLRRSKTTIRKMKEDIIEGIIKKFDGIFLIADLLLKQILEKKVLTWQDLVTIFDEAPKNLGTYFDEALGRIEHRQVHEMLIWLCLCRRDLSSFELMDALRVQVDDSDSRTDTLDESDIDDLIAAAEGLVIQDPVSKVVRFYHESAREHIIKSLDANNELKIAKVLLKYLSFPELTMPLSPKTSRKAAKAIEKRYPLLQYAARYWGDHADASNEVAGALREEILHFLNLQFRVSDMYLPVWANRISIREALRYWKGSDYEIDPSSQHEQAYLAPGHILPAAHITVFFGSLSMLQLLAEDGSKLEERTAPGGTPLLWAARLNRLDQARFLLERDSGATVNVPGIHGLAPIHEAVKCASMDMIKLLIEYHADIHQKTDDSDGRENPLHKACLYDRDDVVDLLWQHGAGSDIDEGRKDERVLTPLVDILDANRPKSREILLFKHAAFTPFNAIGLPVPLEDAEVLRRLLDQGTDPNQQFGLGQSSLDVALRLGERILVEKCLDLGGSLRLYWRIDDPAITNLRKQSSQALMEKVDAQLKAQTKPIFSKSCHDEITTESKKTYIEIEIPKDKPQVKRIMFTITSHDQGWSSFPETQGGYRGSQTFFVAKIHERGEGKSLTPILYPRFITWNVHASAEWKTHTIMWDVRDQKKGFAKWMKGLRAGNVLHLNARSAGQGSGWANFVKEARIDFFDD